MIKDLERYNHLNSKIQKSEVHNNIVDFIFERTAVDVPEIDEASAWNRLEAKLTKPKNNYFYLKIAASIVLIACVGALIIGIRNSSVQTIASNNEKISVIFPDGSKGVLNKASSFTFPDEFRSERKISFTGEAYFDIKKSKKPFIIDANGVDVKVLGTAFNLITNNKEVVLYVDRGLVAFLKDGEETKVEAGLEARFNKKNNEVVVIKQPTLNTMSWRNGYFKFKDTPLNSAIKDLSEYYEVDFQLSNSKLKNCRVSATIDNQSLDWVLVLLEKILDVKAELKNKSVKIIGKGC